VDESVSFWGGSMVLGPTGDVIVEGPLYDEALVFAEVPLADVRRARIGLPLLRDERPELLARELGRIVAERAGLAEDGTPTPAVDG
jgi:predicted amidohydrolase